VLSQLLTVVYALLFLLLGSMGAISAGNSLRQTAFVPNYHPRRRGRVKAKGLVRATDPAQTYMTPLSQTQCIAYRISITRKTGKNASTTLYQETCGQGNLSLQTQHGTLPISPCKLQLQKVHYQDHYNILKDFHNPLSHQILKEKNITLKNIAGIKRSLTISEYILCNGDPAYMVGQQAWNNGQQELKAVIVTDQPVRRLVLVASVMLTGSLVCIYIATAMIQAVFQ